MMAMVMTKARKEIGGGPDSFSRRCECSSLLPHGAVGLYASQEAGICCGDLGERDLGTGTAVGGPLAGRVAGSCSPCEGDSDSAGSCCRDERRSCCSHRTGKGRVALRYGREHDGPSAPDDQMRARSQRMETSLISLSCYCCCCWPLQCTLSDYEREVRRRGGCRDWMRTGFRGEWRFSSSFISPTRAHHLSKMETS
jgi:hypothetical protein